MRFTLISAGFIILSVSAWAQHGGGGHASFSGGHMASGGHASANTHLGGNGNFGRGGYGYVNRGTSGYYRPIPYLWSLYPNYYDPFLFGDSGYASGPDYGAGYGDPNAYAGGYDPYQPGPDPQTAYLTAQVQQLSDQLNAAEQHFEQPGLRVPMAPQAAPSAAPAIPITLVLKDGRRFQVQNYAVMDQTFWDFTTQPVKKIPLANIDIAASQRLSAANGADFPDLTPPNGSGH